MTLFPEPSSSIAGAIGLTVLSIFGAISGEAIGDTISGKRGKESKDQSNDIKGENKEVSSIDSVDYTSQSVALNMSDADNITPVNVKKELNIASVVSSMNESPEISYISMANDQSGVSATAGTGGISSKSPSDSLPTIPTSDFANTSIALTESMFNVVV